MRLTKIQCDGCGRSPNILEWLRGEFSTDGYHDWRHPAIAFKEAGCPISYDNRGKAERMFQALFGREMPEQAGFLCPRCQRLVDEELPVLWEADEGDDVRAKPRAPWRG